MNSRTIEIKFHTNLGQTFDIVFKDVPTLPFMSTNLEYINKSETFEGVPCHLCTTHEGENHIFVIHSKKPKVTQLMNTFSNYQKNNCTYEIDEDDMYSLEDLYVDFEC